MLFGAAAAAAGQRKRTIAFFPLLFHLLFLSLFVLFLDRKKKIGPGPHQVPPGAPVEPRRPRGGLQARAPGARRQVHEKVRAAVCDQGQGRPGRGGGPRGARRGPQGRARRGGEGGGLRRRGRRRRGQRRGRLGAGPQGHPAVLARGPARARRRREQDHREGRGGARAPPRRPVRGARRWWWW